MLARIINNELELDLPSFGMLSDGRSVSGYNLLPIEELNADGWKEAVLNQPECTDSEYLVIDSFTDGDVITVNYRVEIQAVIPNPEIEALRERVDGIDGGVDALFTDVLPAIMTMI
jgi:hypothetical protein